MRVPSVNIKDNTRSYDLEMAVPGFKKSDLKVEVNEGVLSISSEKEKETEEERNGYTCREFNTTPSSAPSAYLKMWRPTK